MGEVSIERETPVPGLEQHFTVSEISKAWHMDEKLVRKMFMHEPGVVKFGRGESRSKRSYVSLRIPASVAERVHRRISA